MDNAYFWRDYKKKLNCGVFDWGNMGVPYSAVNKRVVSGRGASPGEVLVVVLVDLVVAEVAESRSAKHGCSD